MIDPVDLHCISIPTLWESVDSSLWYRSVEQAGLLSQLFRGVYDKSPDKRTITEH